MALLPVINRLLVGRYNLKFVPFDTISNALLRTTGKSPMIRISAAFRSTGAAAHANDTVHAEHSSQTQGLASDLDSLTGQMLTKQVIVITGERIAEVGPEGKVNIPAGARVIAVAGTPARGVGSGADELRSPGYRVSSATTSVARCVASIRLVAHRVRSATSS